MVDVPRERFEELVSEALDSIPPDLARVLSNCVILVEDDVPPGSPSLLGLYEGTRKCIVRRESGGNYRISSPGGRYRGAYQFNAGLARATAYKMGRRDLAGKPISSWSRFDQDKAFWVVWNHGRGAGHWGGTRHGC